MTWTLKIMCGTALHLAVAFLLPITPRANAIAKVQSEQPRQSEVPVLPAALRGTVRDSQQHTIQGAQVWLRPKKPGAQTFSATTDSSGMYLFNAVPPGTYSLGAAPPRRGNPDSTNTSQANAEVHSFTLAPNESRTFNLILGTSSSTKLQTPPPEFSDDIHFTVAGVTDTSNLGGHGSDVVMRNREAVAEEAAVLGAKAGHGRETSQPTASSIAPSSNDTIEKSLRANLLQEPESFNANYRLGKWLVETAKPEEALPYLQKAERQSLRDLDNASEQAALHHLLGDVDEALAHPLPAVHEYEEAARLDPSEPNLFDWGSELLTHHAAEPAVEVFTKGSRLFSKSFRMFIGLGAALYSLGSYDRAVDSLCRASDMNPQDPTPYLLMGKMQSVQNAQTSSIAQHLARFLDLQPQSALANYYYAVSLWKGRNTSDKDAPAEGKRSPDTRNMDQIRTLLEKAVQLDPKLGLASLQMGIIYWEQKDVQQAISWYERAIAADPSLEQAHYRLSRAYRQSGDAAKAHSEFELYEKISLEKSEEIKRQHHETQQFVYKLRDQERPSGER